MTIDTEIKALASHIMKAAMQEGDAAPSFEEKTEALKTCTSLYAIVRRYDGKQGGDEDAEPGFDKFAETLREVEEKPDGRTAKVRSRRGAGTAGH